MQQLRGRTAIVKMHRGPNPSFASFVVAMVIAVSQHHRRAEKLPIWRSGV